ncbi:zinc transporter, ZIP family [Leucobacter chromiiresistens]|uniref:Zinc transporter, ZIP family n=1 Tax=Leucobacter chromiiresistens TaxID=1079994 RepID=A0A1H0Y9R2_9MICO|nr:zinc transporter, ZIP family [Leucobacter chromiiresistens]
MIPMWLQALWWGFVGGAALLLGAFVAWRWRIPPKAISTIMAFGAGVLISALAFELVDEAADGGGLIPTVSGFLTGAVIFVAANAVLARKGARHRKRSSGRQKSESEQPGSGTAIAVGALLDGVPESLVLGLGLVTAGAVSPAMLVAVFISNVPEGLSSSAGMKQAGRSAAYVFGVWSVIAVLSGVSAAAGFLLLDGAPGGLIAFITALAAGAILAMLSDSMIPEAFENDHMLTGLTTALGFAVAFTVHSIGG